MSVVNLSRIILIRGKLFPDRYLHPLPPIDFICVCCQSCTVSRGNRCVKGNVMLKSIFKILKIFPFIIIYKIKHLPNISGL